MRWLYIVGPLATLLYVIVGLALHGWGWGWVFFLIPAALGTVLYRGGYGGTSESHTERDDRRAQRRAARRNR